MVKSLNRAVVEYKSRLNEPQLRPVDQIRLEKDLHDAEVFLENLVSGNSEMFHEHMLIHIQASSLEELDQITHQIKAQMSKWMKTLIPHFRMIDAFHIFCEYFDFLAYGIIIVN